MAEYRISGFWKSDSNVGETVEVMNGLNDKYLMSNPDKTKTDNLAHLINYKWIVS